MTVSLESVANVPGETENISVVNTLREWRGWPYLLNIVALLLWRSTAAYPVFISDEMAFPVTMPGIVHVLSYVLWAVSGYLIVNYRLALDDARIELRTLDVQLVTAKRDATDYEMAAALAREEAGEAAHRELDLAKEVVDVLTRAFLRDVLQMASHTARISVYYRDHEREGYMLISRYCGDPDLEGRGRGLVPNDGIVRRIGRDHAPVHEVGGPCPVNDLSAYREWQLNQCGLTHLACIDTIRMKSRSYFGLRLENEGRLFGALVVESTDADGVELSTTKQNTLRRMLPVMVRVAQRVVTMTPDSRDTLEMLEEDGDG